MNFWFRGLLAVALIGCARAQTPAPAVDHSTPNDAFLLVCAKGSASEVGALLDKGALLEGPNYSGQTPLMLAADQNGKLVKFLLGKGAKIDAVDNNHCTALLHACWSDEVQGAIDLIDAGADVSLATTMDQTPLMYAARAGDDELVKALLDHHADVNFVGRQGSATSWAANSDRFTCVKLLLDSGADLSRTSGGNDASAGAVTADSAVMNGDVALLDLLVAHGMSIDATGADGRTALMYAVQFGQSDIVDRLLVLKADLNLQDRLGNTAVMYSMADGQPGILANLIKHGADLNLKNKDGMTALMLAAQKGNADALNQLLPGGADVNVTDLQGETALTLAGDVGQLELVETLKSRGARRQDVHFIVKPGPATALPPAKQWALAVGAIYDQVYGYSTATLGHTSSFPINDRGALLRFWQIRDRSSFLGALDNLEKNGTRVGCQAEGAQLMAMTDEDFQRELRKHPESAAQLKGTLDCYKKWKERSGLAFDLCRAANLVNTAFNCHYIKEDEAWSLLLPIAQQVQQSFVSWNEMSDNFLDGRAITENKRDQQFEFCSQLLLNPAEPNSPWNLNDWKTDLSDPAAPKIPAPVLPAN